VPLVGNKEMITGKRPWRRSTRSFWLSMVSKDFRAKARHESSIPDGRLKPGVSQGVTLQTPQDLLSEVACPGWVLIPDRNSG